MGRQLHFAVVLAIGLALGGSRVEAALLIGLTTTDALVTFDSETLDAIASNVPITGLASGESLLAIDRRPADGVLYGLGSSSRIYTINTTTGVATAVSATPFFPPLSGAAFGFDFDPLTDQIRVVSSNGTNFRLNPNNGTLAGSDSPLVYAVGDTGQGIAPQVVGLAYSNNFNGATVTTLFGIDFNRDVLVRVGGPNGSPSPNGGELTTIGLTLGVNTTDLVGFDIDGLTGVAFASLTSPIGGTSQLYTINLADGNARLARTIGELTLRGLAADVGEVGASPIPEPSSLILFCVGGLSLLPFVRRRLLHDK
jgi:hypothetical protein